MVRCPLLFEQAPEQGAHYTPHPSYAAYLSPVRLGDSPTTVPRTAAPWRPPRGIRGETEVTPRNSEPTRGRNGGGAGGSPWPGSLPTRCGGRPSGYRRESRELPVAPSAASPRVGRCESTETIPPAAPARGRPPLPVQRQVAFAVPPDERAVGRARHMLRDTLISWGSAESDERIPDAELVATELLTNALRHAPCKELALSAAEGGGSLIIEVQDGGSSSSVPTVQDAVPDEALSGRGMTIVDALTQCWSYRPLPNGGRSTWAMLAWAGEARR
ncbi:ATP-binding protein [Streptomyces mobaraensis]|uniref:ATP-binding protein n=1 Tax=Streptomyces mobaraensis TaxID=35621 RepID=UPI0033211D72